MPGDQPRKEDDRIAQTSRSRECKRGGAVETEQCADQQKAALLHTERTRNDERRARDRLDDRFDEYRVEDASRLAEKIEREPDLDSAENPTGELPREAGADVATPRVD